MHELGVVFYVIKDVKEVAKENQISKVNVVTLDIGEVSGVIKEQLQDCWKWAIKREPILDGAELKVNTIPGVTYCEGCGKVYETVKHGRICPYCGSADTWLKQGNEFSIKEIEVSDGDSGA